MSRQEKEERDSPVVLKLLLQSVSLEHLSHDLGYFSAIACKDCGLLFFPSFDDVCPRCLESENRANEIVIEV